MANKEQKFRDKKAANERTWYRDVPGQNVASWLFFLEVSIKFAFVYS
ncbi:hypothetical protein NGI46_27675 [Peribacillus butanolivorans]|nr:hypothetical protein [Peribacillus butanolivorans]MCO0601089.1 hypothetical protein [Peribacillus butanolivorans]